MNSQTLLKQNVKDVLRPMAREICTTIPAPSSWVVSADREELVKFILASDVPQNPDAQSASQSASQALSVEEVQAIAREEVARIMRVFGNFVDVHKGEI